MADGIISALQAKFASLTYSGKAKRIWFGTAPLKDVDGTAVDLPIIQIFHTGTSNTVTFESASIQVWQLRIEVYAYTLEDCVKQCNGILFNNQAPENRLGFAYTDILNVPVAYIFNQLVVTSQPTYRRLDQVRTKDATAPHQGIFSMDLQVQFQGDPPPT